MYEKGLVGFKPVSKKVKSQKCFETNKGARDVLMCYAILAIPAASFRIVTQLGIRQL